MIVKYGMNSKQTTTTSGHSQPQTPLQSVSSPHSPDSPQSVGTIPSSASIMAHSISGVGVSVGGGSQTSGGRRRRSPEDQNNNNDSDTRSNSSGSRSGTRSQKSIEGVVNQTEFKILDGLLELEILLQSEQLRHSSERYLLDPMGISKFLSVPPPTHITVYF